MRIFYKYILNDVELASVKLLELTVQTQAVLDINYMLTFGRTRTVKRGTGFSLPCQTMMTYCAYISYYAEKHPFLVGWLQSPQLVKVGINLKSEGTRLDTGLRTSSIQASAFFSNRFESIGDAKLSTRRFDYHGFVDILWPALAIWLVE